MKNRRQTKINEKLRSKVKSRTNVLSPFAIFVILMTLGRTTMEVEEATKSGKKVAAKRKVEEDGAKGKKDVKTHVLTSRYLLELFHNMLSSANS